MNSRVGPVFRLAVTGGIAEGKSTVLGYLAELGVKVASSDEIVRSLWIDGSMQRSLAARFGRPDVTRDEVRAAILHDAEARRAVNAATHGLVLGEMLSSGAAAIEVPLLVETCLTGLFRRVWVVTCGPEEQLRRLTERTQDRESARLALASQLATEVKVTFADAVIRTNLSPTSVMSAVERTARAHGLI